MSNCRADFKEVIAINKSELDEPSINAFITPANLIIDAAVADCGVTIALESLHQAEIWLTAHLMAVSNAGQDEGSGTGTKKKETFENYTIEWATSAAKGDAIMSTHYGQMANTMMKGCLVEQDKRQAGILFAGGT